MLRLPSVVLFALLAAACGGGGNGLLGGAGKKEGAEEKKKEGEGGLEPDKGEDIKTTEPVQVSGAALVAECGKAEEERATVVGAAADAIILGCRYEPSTDVALTGVTVVRGTTKTAAKTFAPVGKTWMTVFAEGDVATLSAFDLTLTPKGKEAVVVRAKLVEGTLPNQPVVTASCGTNEILVGKACLKWVKFEERVKSTAGVPVNIVYVPENEATPDRTNNGGAFHAFKGVSCKIEDCKLDATKQILDDGTLPIFRMVKGDEVVYASIAEARDFLVGKGYTSGNVAFRLLPGDREDIPNALVRLCRSQNRKAQTVHDLTSFTDWKTKIQPDTNEWLTTTEAQGCGSIGVGRY